MKNLTNDFRNVLDEKLWSLLYDNMSFKLRQELNIYYTDNLFHQKINNIIVNIYDKIEI